MKKKDLDEERAKVLREGETEPAFSGALVNNKEKGLYMCGYCGTELFSSDDKFDSGSGWPSFDRASKDESIKLVEDKSLGMVRTEVKCKKCDSHLGHVFEDGPSNTTGKRYCINSLALDFNEHE